MSKMVDRTLDLNSGTVENLLNRYADEQIIGEIQRKYEREIRSLNSSADPSLAIDLADKIIDESLPADTLDSSSLCGLVLYAIGGKHFKIYHSDLGRGVKHD